MSFFGYSVILSKEPGYAIIFADTIDKAVCSCFFGQRAYPLFRLTEGVIVMYITLDNYIQLGLLIVAIIGVVISIMNYIKK